MHGASGETRGRLPSRSRHGAVLAAALLALSLVGCSADAGPQGGPPSTTEAPAPSPDDASPSSSSPSPDAEEATDDANTAPTDGTPAPEADEPADDPMADPDGDEEGPAATGPAAFDGAATDDWKAPDDPTAQGPTAAPELPEVTGAIGEPVSLPTDVAVDLTSVTTTSLTAQTPGEYTGDAVVVEVRISNEADAALPLDAAVVTLTAEDGDVGIGTGAAPYAPLQGEVAPGEAATGTYVFMLDPADGRSVTLRVGYAAGGPVAVFTGTTP